MLCYGDIFQVKYKVKVFKTLFHAPGIQILRVLNPTLSGSFEKIASLKDGLMAVNKLNLLCNISWCNQSQLIIIIKELKICKMTWMEEDLTRYLLEVSNHLGSKNYILKLLLSCIEQSLFSHFSLKSWMHKAYS